MATKMFPNVAGVIIFMFVILLLPEQSQQKIDTGLIETSHFQNWIFVTRFCFLSKAGRLQFEFYYPREYDEGVNAAQNILLYHDIQWPSVYPTKNSARQSQANTSSLSCYEKEGVLLPENNQVINLTTRYRWSGCNLVQINNEDWYRCRGGRTFSSTRERWWYIVVDNCATTKGLYLNYTITMTNDLGNDTFFKHYSADEFYILQETIAFFIVYLFLLCLSIYVAYSLHLRQLYHTTYKLYMASMCIEYVALVAQLIYWADYGLSGVPKRGWKNIGRFLEFTGQILFVILLILMGKGYTITRGRISVSGTVKIIVFSIFFISMTVAMLVWEAVSFDPALVLYLYDSIPGYALIAVKIASWLWFIYAIVFTLKHYPEKIVFYIPFVVLYTLWFWSGTIVALVAIDNIPRWIKEKVVQGCVLFITFLGHLIFLILTWPTMASKTFPYHIKTTQVGAMQPGMEVRSNNNNNNRGVTEGGAYGPNGIDNAYEPIGERQFMAMFTTDHTSRSNGQAQTVDPDHFPHERPEHTSNLVS